jgi:hypothetical protein
MHEQLSDFPFHSSWQNPHLFHWTNPRTPFHKFIVAFRDISQNTGLCFASLLITPVRKYDRGTADAVPKASTQS